MRIWIGKNLKKLIYIASNFQINGVERKIYPLQYSKCMFIIITLFFIVDPTCRLCGEAIESSQHCMWSCIYTQEVWKRNLRILARSGGYGEVSWVPAQWLMTDQESWFSQFNESCPFMQLERDTIRMTDSPSWLQTKSTDLKSVWTIHASLTTWQIWKHYCRRIFLLKFERISAETWTSSMFRRSPS